MSLLSAALALSLFGGAAPQDPAAPWNAALYDELEELYPDSATAAGTAMLSLDSPRGVPAGIHLLLTGMQPDEPVMISLAGREELTSTALWFRLHDVPVEENTGLGSRTEVFDGERNPHVVRRAPFRIFEALEPLARGARLEHRPAAAVMALRLEVPVPANAAVGTHPLRIRIAHAGRAQILEWSLQVHAAVVPPAGRDTLAYTNWFSPDEVARRHGLEPWSEEFWPMLAQYAAMMAHGRQNVFWVRWADFFHLDDSGTPHLHRARLERYVATFRAAGLWWIEGAPLAHRPGGDWSSPVLELNVANVPATGDAGRAALATMLGELDAAIEENGWRAAWLQHLADEPTDVNAADYTELAALVREHLPGIPIVEATMSTELVGAVDVWCPQVHKFQQNRAFFEQRRAAGDRVWTYTCLVPGGPWLNRLLDQERLRQVYIGWAAAHFGVHGFLHWGLNHYKADPFAQSVVDHPAQPGTKNKLPAGDTHVIYPGPDGPWSSQRFEAHRIGMEDHALLEQLRARDSAAAAAVIQRVFRGYDDYATEVAAYRAARRALLETLTAE
ncbi:MAG TPA: DUF4091 domain-containing protein [Planctomycetota bacterium]